MVGVFAFYIGLFFVCPHLVFLIGFVVFVVNMHHRNHLEESQLAFRFERNTKTTLALSRATSPD